jgi:hypothetical protein
MTFWGRPCLIFPRLVVACGSSTVNRDHPHSEQEDAAVQVMHAKQSIGSVVSLGLLLLLVIDCL